MRFIARLGGIASVSTALLVAFPSPAAAQHTVSGRLVELIPGGTPLPDSRVHYGRVAADGSTTYFDPILTCIGGATANCIAADGVFAITGLSSGTYLLYPADRISPVLDKYVSVNVNTSVDIGSVQLIRAPFKIEVSVGSIPPAGGLIPVTARVRTTWNIPTLPIVARIEEFQETTADGETQSDVPQIVSFVWPSGLTDSGPVNLSSLRVSPDDPAGGAHCVLVTLHLEGNRKRTLGSSRTICSYKRP